MQVLILELDRARRSDGFPSQNLIYVYRLLVHDKMVQPLREDQVAEGTMRHKLAIWYSKQLSEDHPLLK